MKTQKSESELKASSDSSVPILGDGLNDRISAAADLLGSRINAAEVAGVSVDMLAKYIAGTSRPRFDAMVRLAAGAGVSLDWLASGAGEKMRDSEQDTVKEEKNHYAPAPQQAAIDTPAPRRPWGLIPLDRPLPVILRVLDVLEREGVRIPREALPDILTLVLALPDDPDNPCLLARLTHLVEE